MTAYEEALMFRAASLACRLGCTCESEWSHGQRITKYLCTSCQFQTEWREYLKDRVVETLEETM